MRIRKWTMHSTIKTSRAMASSSKMESGRRRLKGLMRIGMRMISSLLKQSSAFRNPARPGGGMKSSLSFVHFLRAMTASSLSASGPSKRSRSGHAYIGAMSRSSSLLAATYALLIRRSWGSAPALKHSDVGGSCVISCCRRLCVGSLACSISCIRHAHEGSPCTASYWRGVIIAGRSTYV